MAREWLKGLVKAFYIAKKDAKVYYFKAPNFTYGLLIPVSLFLAFAMAGQMNPTTHRARIGLPDASFRNYID